MSGRDSAFDLAGEAALQFGEVAELALRAPSRVLPFPRFLGRTPATWQPTPGSAAAGAARTRFEQMEPYVESTGADGVYEVIEEVTQS
jgi:hypothetical protein